MATLNWEEIDAQYASQYKSFADYGTYKVKCIGVEFKDAGTKGNKVIKFQFEDSEQFRFPTADHWLVKDKQNWRVYHMRNLFVALGSTEEKARKACELAESKDDFAYAAKAYEKGFSALLAKKPEVEIEVFPDGKYARAEFTDRTVAMRRNNDEEEATAENSGNDILANDDGSDEPIDLSEIPF